MAIVLRKIQKAKWYKSTTVPWLSENDLQADALADLTTKGNKLSVYVIEDNPANIEQVAAALATTREFIKEFDYAVFDQEVLSEVNIRVDKTEGETPDSNVNKWHYDLVELTSAKIMALAEVIRVRARRERILGKRIRTLVAKAIVSSQVDRTKIKLNAESLAQVDVEVLALQSNTVIP